MAIKLGGSDASAFKLGSQAVSAAYLGSSRVDTDLSGYLLYDAFSGTVAALNGRAPQKGAAWTSSGPSAAFMQAGGGQLKQTNDTPAAYAFNQLSQNPGKLVAKWQNDNGASGAVPTMAICPSTILTSGIVIHGELGTANPFVRSINNGTFLVPAWSVSGAGYVLSSGVNYTTELYWDGKWVRIRVYNGASLIGEQVAYDPLFNTGGQYVYWETLDTHLAYTLATAEAKPQSGYTWPTLNVLAELANPTTSNFVANAVFGGSVANSGSGIVITGASYGQGGTLNLGSSTTGDKFSVSFDVSSRTAGNWECALLATGAAETEKSNILLFAANGRVNGALTATDTRSMSLAIAVDSSGVGGSVTISNVVVVKNPPTAP